ERAGRWEAVDVLALEPRQTVNRGAVDSKAVVHLEPVNEAGRADDDSLSRERAARLCDFSDRLSPGAPSQPRLTALVNPRVGVEDPPLGVELVELVHPRADVPEIGRPKGAVL